MSIQQLVYINTNVPALAIPNLFLTFECPVTLSSRHNESQAAIYVILLV